LLHGAGGDDQISGANGIDILFGDTGDDALIGGAGNDFIYGGVGNDVLNGGAGDDYLKGNGGDDRFVFDGDAGGRDTISEFRKHGADKIEIDAGLGSSIAQIIGSASTDASGDAVLHIGSGLTITLLGVGTGELKGDMFHIA
jgi:Ca2+-binding RTX toxin-like protein